MPYKYFMDINRESCEFGWVYRAQQEGTNIVMVNEMSLDKFTIKNNELITYVEITKTEYNKRIMECSR